MDTEKADTLLKLGDDTEPTLPKGTNAEKNKKKKERSKRKKEEAKKKADEEGESIVDRLKPLGLEINASPIHGQGLFALVDIQKGVAILSEAPLLVFGVLYDYFRVEGEVMLVTNAKKKRIFDMKTMSQSEERHSTETDLMKIYATNAHQSTADGCMYIYEVASRINHECMPSATVNFLARGTVVLVAAREIKAGEEITISYGLTATGPGIERRKKIAQTFNFACRCTACKTNRHVKVEFNTTSFSTNNLDKPIFNQHTKEELEAATRVGEWYQELRELFDKLGLNMSRKVAAATGHNLATNTTVFKWEDEVEAAGKEWDEHLASHNEFGLSEDVLGKLAKPDKLHLREKGMEMTIAAGNRFQQQLFHMLQAKALMAESIPDST